MLNRLKEVEMLIDMVEVRSPRACERCSQSKYQRGKAAASSYEKRDFEPFSGAGVGAGLLGLG